MYTFKEVLTGLAIFLVIMTFLVLTIGGGLYNANTNSEKVRELTRYCVEQGFDGFYDDSYDGEKVGCYKD
jgi:hypothetical protein